jgi:hypothetical protein
MYERKVAPPILSFTLRAPGNTIKGKDLSLRYTSIAKLLERKDRILEG